MATEMMALTCYVDKETCDAIYEMRKHDEYIKCSRAEICRRLILRGLEASGITPETVKNTSQS